MLCKLFTSEKPRIEHAVLAYLGFQEKQGETVGGGFKNYSVFTAEVQSGLNMNGHFCENSSRL